FVQLFNDVKSVLTNWTTIQFFTPKTSDDLQKNENDQNEKEAVKKPKFFRNLKMAGMISLGMLASSGESFSQEGDSGENKDLKQSEFVLPVSSWKFIEGYDSVLAENDSKIYPGLVENYMKNEDGKYKLYQYTDRDGNILETPDYLQEAIALEKQKLAEYANPEEWAKNRFEYQKTLEFKTAALQNYVIDMENTIKELSGRLELFTDTSTYSRENRELDEKDIDRYKKSIIFFQEHPEKLIEEKSIEELTKEATGYVFLIKRQIGIYQESLNSVLEYIEKNKK
ncbi:MAG: hypothetical protein WCJ57_03165, partial [Candidatus Falkowbacteria bacterium]